VKSAQETLSPTRVKLTIEVPFEELQPSLDAAYKQIGAQITIPGFRKGKVPAKIVDQRVGRGAVLDQAINDALPGIYGQAVQEHELQPLSQPEIDITKLEDGETLELIAELDVRPEIELPNYEGLEVEVEDIATATDDDVEEQIRALRERFATLEDLERPAADGDFVTIDLSASSKDGTPLEGAQAEGMTYQIGKETMLEGLDEALTDLSVGESTTFSTTLVGGDMAGQEVDVEVTAQAVKLQELPEVDEEFAQTASEFDTVEELRADIIERLARGKRMEQANEARDAVLEKLLEQIDAPVPDGVLAEEVQSRREQINQQLAYAGMTMEQYLDNEEQTVDEFDADLEKRVRDSLLAQFVLDDVAAKEEIGLDEAELTQYIVRRAQQAGTDPQEYAQHMMEHNHVPQLASEVVRGKALASIVEAATVTDKSGNVVTLKGLQADGTYADETTADDGTSRDGDTDGGTDGDTRS